MTGCGDLWERGSGLQLGSQENGSSSDRGESVTADLGAGKKKIHFWSCQILEGTLGCICPADHQKCRTEARENSGLEKDHLAK